MPQPIFTRLAVATALVAGLALPVAAQSVSSAQCDAVMMQGTQNSAPALVAACQPYFQALADGNVARGTFHTMPVPRPQSVTLSTSGTGG